MPYSIAFLSKYPPLEGGIAARTYWLARGLASCGHEVHIITDNLSVGGEYGVQSDDILNDGLASISVHRTPLDIPWHIPEDQERSLSLLDLTLQVIRQFNVDILDTGYLIPYGIVGDMSKRMTGVSHVLRHGGSDLEKFLRQNVLGTALAEAIANADAVITDKQHKNLFNPLARSIFLQYPYIPDNAFAGTPRKGIMRRLAAIGKVNFYWRHKRLDYIAEIMEQLFGRLECLIIGQGNGLEDFKNSLTDELRHTIVWHPFVPPWEMPNLLRQLDAIFVLESALPYPMFSSVALEALCSGLGVITDRSDLTEALTDVIVPTDDQICVIPSDDSAMAASQIGSWLEHRAFSPPQRLVGFDQYLHQNEAIYSDLLR